MNSNKAILVFTLMCVIILLSGWSSNKSTNQSETTLVGCTPGDPLIKSLLNILPETNVDFIRWNLTLKEPDLFDLSIVYGEAKPNTLGFIDGGEKLTFEGGYTESTITEGNITKTILRLDSYDNKVNTISMIKINDNLYHLLTPGNQLMVGNAGWSYTLNRKEPVSTNVLPSLSLSDALLKDTVRQIIYVGRTPCIEFARENNLSVPPDCFKIKWKLTLNRNPKTLLPTTYSLYRTNSTEPEIEGNWDIIKGLPSNSDIVIYRLDPDKPGQSLSLFVADANVVFFLDKSSQLITGNGDFSYTLNKRNKEKKITRGDKNFAQTR